MYSTSSQSTTSSTHTALLTQELPGAARPSIKSSVEPLTGKAQALMTRQEAAAYIGVQQNTLAAWACTQRYDLPYVKVGRNVRYRQQDLDAFIMRNTHGVDAGAITMGGANV